MKNWKRYNIIGLFIATLLVLGIVSLNAYLNFSHMAEDTKHMAEADLDYANLRINNEMNHVEQIVNDVLPTVRMMVNAGATDSILHISRNVLKEYEFVLACEMVFCPNDSNHKGRMVSVGMHRKGQVIEEHNTANDTIDYTQREWYIIPVNEHRQVWTDPYFAQTLNKTVCTRAAPVTNNQGKVIGVFFVDVPLDWLQEGLDVSKMYNGSRYMLLNIVGRVVLSSDSIQEMPDSTQNLIYRGKVGNRGSQLLIAVPIKEIYSKIINMSLISGLLLLLTALLILYILHRAVRSAFKLQAATFHNEVMNKELSIANDIQMGMVRAKELNLPEVELYASMKPAKAVGGDLYDYDVIDGRLFFCVGDVSGKGIPAALFMTTAVNLFRMAIKSQTDPAAIATQMNDLLSQNNRRSMFVSMFIGVVDLKTGVLNFCNAGHNPPVVDGRFMEVKANIPLGLVGDMVFESETYSNIIGKPLFFYTDGLNEAKSIDNEQFGNERLLSELKAKPFKSCSERVEWMRSAVEKHTVGAEPSDDMTMMCIEVKK
jgi:hypothetical protein